MNTFYHEKECQNATQRELSLFSRLPDFIAYAKQESNYYQKILTHIDEKKISTRELLAQLPITRKSELINLQTNNPPFAGLNTATATISRMFQSPGPICEPENDRADWWRMGQAFYAAGFRKNDLVQNCLSYHLTPGGFIMDSGARACGCIVIPAGPGQSDQQLELIESLKPQGFCGTPSFLKILIDKAAIQGKNISSITKALVSGEALPEKLRTEFNDANIDVLQAYASADIGLIGFESYPNDGFIIAEDIIIEIVRPGSLEPVTEGEIGEVVVTSFNLDYPLIRFATGDLSAIKTGTSACGRTNMRIKGWLGRADQTTKVKGMFVHPEQIEKVRQSDKNIVKVRLSVTNENHNDNMLLQCEIDSSTYSTKELNIMTKNITKMLKDITKLSGFVEIVTIGTLVNDGKVIDDLRAL